jgi:hypothetical protein
MEKSAIINLFYFKSPKRVRESGIPSTAPITAEAVVPGPPPIHTHSK